MGDFMSEEFLLPETKKALEESRKYREKIEIILKKWREAEHTNIYEFMKDVDYVKKDIN